MKQELRTTIPAAAFACLLLAIVPAQAKVTLYSSKFGGSSGSNLHGTAVDTSGATAAQHTQYGTSAAATWSADSSLKADGGYVHPGSANRVSGTLPFVPKNGYVYTLAMTTNHAVSADNSDWFGTGFFMQPGYTGMIHTGNGATVWALTRPGSGFSNGDQVAHYNLFGGQGAVGAPSASEDTTAPSTLTIVLNTTAGTGNWSATYYVGNDLLATVADLNAVDIESVGIGATIEIATATGGKFQAFELSVTDADITLYSSAFIGNSGDPLNGQAVVTLGATAAQHTQYGTSATAAWSAATNIKADGSFVFTGSSANNLANSGGGTLPFAPKNGYVYTLSMTTDLSVATTLSNWFATGFFMQPNYAGKVNIANGATVWALTRPGNANFNGDQVAHYNLAGGAGGVGVPSANEDTSAPSTLRIVLDTTLGTGNWSATYYVDTRVLASVADLNAVDIESVGIGATFDGASTSPGKFQAFELSVAGGGIPPAIATLVPDEVTGVYPGTPLVATFSKDIALTGSGSILIDDITGSSDIAINLTNPSQVSVTGATLTIIPPASLAPGKNFEVLIGPGTIRDTASPANAFPGTTAGQWTFSTAAQDLTAPVITLKSPLDNATGVSRSANIVATFDDNILIGTGNITIKDLADGSTTKVIPVSDAAQVTISGKVLTINPTAPLAADRNYAVQIAAGAVKNFSDVGFAGIPGSDDITWNFQTAALKPNVIFILGDDQGWYDYGFMQRPGVDKAAVSLNPSIPQIVKTPAIDRLADEGLAFIHGYSAPVCRPALASIITGTYLQQHWITGNDLVNSSGAVINDSTVEARMQVLHPLPRTLFNQLGYTSFQTGKWWEGHYSNGGFTHGDTVNSIAAGTQPPEWSGTRPYYVNLARHGDWGLMAGRVDYVNDIEAPAHPIPYANTVQTVTNFINTQVAADKPFFVWYAPYLPHDPFDPPSGLLAQYTALGLSSADAKYYANIERFDGGVGAVLNHLDAQGIANNTIVIMICDNGRQLDLTTAGKMTPYESGVRSPIIVRWPDRIKPGGAIAPQVIRTPVNMVDMAPTVHHALGLPIYPEMRGINLLDPAAVAARATVCGSNHDHDIVDLSNPTASLNGRFATRDGWKLILFTNGTKQLFRLYNGTTPVDPHETNNLAAGNPQLVNDLTVKIVNWYADDYNSWISDPALGIALANRGFGLDPDGDGLTSGVEAWFGTDPRAFNAGLVNLGTNGTTTTFTHPRNENPPSDLTGYYEWSPNLVDWYAGNGVAGPSGGPTVNIVASTTGTTTTVTATSSVEVQRLFLRARVAQN